VTGKAKAASEEKTIQTSLKKRRPEASGDPALTPPKTTDLHDEVDHYLSTDVEHANNAIVWWHGFFPCLSCMALDYLTIPGKLHHSYDCLLP
jgi:hypothetical protein